MDIHQDLQTRAEIVEERDALAALVTDLRRALERLLPAIAERNHWFDTCTRVLARDWERKASNAIDGLEAALTKADAALSLPLPAAAERVKDWREKAERLDDWATKWEDYVKTPSWGDSKVRESFLEADTNLRRYARELRAARGAK